MERRAMPRTLTGPVRFGIGALILSAAIMPSAPIAAQVLIYEGPYGYARPYGPPPRAYVPAPPRGYGMLPPGEVRAIVVGMGYRQVSRPRLAGRTYVVTAVDEDGPAVLRLDAFTGRVVSARSVYGGPTIAVPTPPGPGPRRPPPPPAPPRSQPPVAAAPSSPAKPLPPSRPPEPAVATVTPAPAVPQIAPAPDAAKAAAPQAPAAPQPAAATPSPPAQSAAPANPGATPANPEAGRSAAQSASAAPQKRKAGAGTATTDSATAGSASVLSRPKAQ
ncbi:conserved hypothetical protein, conserved [Xanthobacter versatilis]|uniref:Uncharacterized protein n=2 Tax=Xanthobacter autotrophicus (strain ATCC BAA-1158 / Py2) TaxID=78245 RepID=A7ICJ3_XANP2|nr:conserved hypothetical protein, conserved [Xanthobacter autotrophicus Py2]